MSLILEYSLLKTSWRETDRRRVEKVIDLLRISTLQWARNSSTEIKKTFDLKICDRLCKLSLSNPKIAKVKVENHWKDATQDQETYRFKLILVNLSTYELSLPQMTNKNSLLESVKETTMEFTLFENKEGLMSTFQKKKISTSLQSVLKPNSSASLLLSKSTLFWTSLETHSSMNSSNMIELRGSDKNLSVFSLLSFWTETQI